MVRGQGEPVDLQVASNKEEVAFQVGLGLHSKEAGLALVQRSLEQRQRCSKKNLGNHEKEMVLGQMLLLKDTSERVYCRC